jgi:hypothetical protein
MSLLALPIAAVRIAPSSARKEFSAAHERGRIADPKPALQPGFGLGIPGGILPGVAEM